MTDSPFAQPGSASGDSFEPKAFGPGVLLLIFPKSHNPAVATKFGDSPGTEADVIVVDRPDASGKPAYFQNAMLFGNLALSTRDSIGSQVLGRLGQGPNTKGNPPWILLDYTDQDQALAMPTYQAYLAGQFKKVEQQNPGTVANAQAMAAQDPWAGVNAAPALGPQQGYAPPAQAQFSAPAAPAAPPQATYAAPGTPNPPAVPQAGSDPLTVFLISRGLDPNAVAAMDPATRQAVATQLGG